MKIATDNEKEFRLLAQCIRTGQVEADELIAIMKANTAFAKWYADKYLNK